MKIETYIGVPYVNKGRDRTGVDCWGLVRLFYREQFGIELSTLDGEYETGRDRAAVARTVAVETAAHWRPVAVPCYGDVVVATIASRPFHAGIVLHGGFFLHALSESQSSVIERLSSPRWARRIEGFFRHESRV